MNVSFQGGSLRQQIMLACAVPMVLLIVLAGLIYFAIQRSRESDALVRHTQDVLLHADLIAKSLVDMETGERGYVITGDEAFLEPYTAGKSTLATAMQETADLVSDNPQQSQRIQQIRRDAQDLDEQQLQVVIQARRSSLDAATAQVRTGRGKAMLDRMRQELDEFSATEKTLLAQRLEANDAANGLLQILVLAGTLVSIVLGLLAAVGVARAIARRVDALARGAAAISSGNLDQRIAQRDGGDEVDTLCRAFNAMADNLRAAASTKVEKDSLETILEESHDASLKLASTASEILASVTQQGASTTEQAAAVSQTTATVDEVRVTAQQSNQRAQAVATMARHAAEVASRGLETVETTVTGMQEIRGRVESIAEQILALSEQTQQIGEIIAVVDNLADQSNLLAVNAAIEASRAGEQGRGFAVVAQEVRSLAERSKAATVQVRTILTDIQRATNAAVLTTEQGTKGAESGVRLVEQAGQAIKQLAETIRESAEAAQQIVASVGQQEAGMNQIAGAMGNINQATTETAAGTLQLQRAAENINELAQRLTLVVGRYRANGTS